jgi:SAM-dependent methyltransferase
MKASSIVHLMHRRTSTRWWDRLRRLLEPPEPLIRDPKELEVNAPLGRWNLYIGGAGSFVDGYVNIDIMALPGVDIVANAEKLPFPGNLFQRVECDAVLEHVENPELVMQEIERVLAPGGYAHIVVPFCHPLHEYPRDYRRFTLDGLRHLAGGLNEVASGWRTGPTATLLVFLLEYAKVWLPWGPSRTVVHGILGWVLFPLRYLDKILRWSPRFERLGNHCYIWLRKD